MCSQRPICENVIAQNSHCGASVLTYPSVVEWFWVLVGISHIESPHLGPVVSFSLISRHKGREFGIKLAEVSSCLPS